MKHLKRLSVKVDKWAELSGYDIRLIKKNMKSNSFSIQLCETREEMDLNGVAYEYPYVLFNPFNLPIKSNN